MLNSTLDCYPTATSVYWKTNCLKIWPSDPIALCIQLMHSHSSQTPALGKFASPKYLTNLNLPASLGSQRQSWKMHYLIWLQINTTLPSNHHTVHPQLVCTISKSSLTWWRFLTSHWHLISIAFLWHKLADSSLAVTSCPQIASSSLVTSVSTSQLYIVIDLTNDDCV